MRETPEGFLVPRIYVPKCVGCGVCRKVCPAANDVPMALRKTEIVCYGGAARLREEALSSTSGGVASVLSRRIVDDGGVVVGAAFDPFPCVRHVCVEDIEGIVRLKGSKYVESDITHALPKIREYLKNGRKVLFVGLPCQVAAVYGFLGGDSEGLYTVDLVCHGKPPQKLFSHWARMLEKMLGGRISEYKFRDKKCCDWNDPDTHLHFYRLTDGRVGSVPFKTNWYGRYFLGSSSFRECCYHCQFARLPRVGDVTLADFWGAERDERFKRFTKHGLSLVAAQSEKGVELLEKAHQDLDLVSCSAEFALSCTGGLNHGSRRTVYRRFLYGFVYLSEPLRRLCDFVLFGSGKLAKMIFKGPRA